MTRREFNQALAFLQLNPPEESANVRTAAVMAQIANFSGRSLPDKKMVSADDYLGKKKQAQTPAEQMAFLKALSPEKKHG